MSESDIVVRLRAGEPCAACWGDTDGTCKVKDAQSGCGCAEAADIITALRAENENLRAALEAICMMDISWVGDAFKLKDIARAALGDTHE